MSHHVLRLYVCRKRGCPGKRRQGEGRQGADSANADFQNFALADLPCTAKTGFACKFTIVVPRLSEKTPIASPRGQIIKGQTRTSATMPVLEIYTNKTIPNKKEIAVKASKLMADLLGKPESVPPNSRLPDKWLML